MAKNPPTAAHLAREKRMNLAAIEGAKARADIDAQGVAIRKNMERLRALRLASEAQSSARTARAAKSAKGKARTGVSKSGVAGATTRKLSDFLKSDKDSGRST